jgi:hypothetical protein
MKNQPALRTNAQDTQLDAVPVLLPDPQEEELIFVKPGGGAEPEAKDKTPHLQPKRRTVLTVGTEGDVQAQWE